MPGFANNNLMYADNVDFSGSNNPSAQVLSNGQLLIGASSAPNIRVGTLSSSDGSITWTLGAGTIAGQVTGGSTVGKTITGDSGGSLSPTLGNWNLFGSGSITTVGSGSTLTAQLTGLTNHALLVGAGTSTITKLAVAATGTALQGNTGADPSFNSDLSMSGSVTAGTSVTASNGNVIVTNGNLTLPQTSSSVGKILLDGETYLHAYGSGVPSNVFLGEQAGNFTFAGGSNIAIGPFAMISLTAASSNIGIGGASLGFLQSGSSNVCLGQSAGISYTTSESSNILIGQGVFGTIGESNITRIGTGQSACYVSGIQGVSVSNKNIVTINTATGQMGSDSSVAVSQGGTGTTTLTDRGVLIGRGTSAIEATAAGSAGQVLRSGGAGANPSYSTATYPSTATGTGTVLRADGTNWVASTATYPDTTTANQLLYSSATNVVGGLATTARSTLTANSSGAPTWSAMTDGQIIIGSTSGSPTAASLTAGTNITITPGSNSITIAATGGGLTWTEVTGTSQNAAVGNGYICNNAGLVTVTLPANFAVGDIVHIVGKGAGLWRLTANTGDTIHFGNQDTTGGGSLTATNRYDAVQVIGITANTDWAVTGVAQGNLTVA